MAEQQSRPLGPLVMGSVFKSGTWLLRRILSGLTGLKPLEPTVRPGNMDPTDARYLRFEPGHFFSWHFTPTAQIATLLREHDARVVFLLRNVYDLVVSMYHHFRDDIDADIGRGAGQGGYFSELDRDEGLRHVILPGTTRRFPWPGVGQHLVQMQCMLRYAAEHPCHLVTFERLQHDRAGEIRQLATFLDIEADAAEIETLCDRTSLARMRAEAQANGAGSHFRQGLAHAHANCLNADHIALINAAMHRQTPDLPKLVSAAGLDELLRSLPMEASKDNASCG